MPRLTEAQKQTVQNALNEINGEKYAYFYSDQRTGVSVAVAINHKREDAVGIGTALCNFNDRFVKPIGLAIALHRAQGTRVPREYLEFDSAVRTVEDLNAEIDRLERDLTATGYKF